MYFSIYKSSAIDIKNFMQLKEKTANAKDKSNKNNKNKNNDNHLNKPP